MSDTYSSRKALKLATALYMVTDIMSEKEPLKWHLRNCAVVLLEADAANILRAIEQTLDILSIARIARAVSPMNADVLEDELRALQVLLTARGSATPMPAPLFTKDFFDVPALATGTNTQKDNVPTQSIASFETAPLAPVRESVPAEQKEDPTPKHVVTPKSAFVAPVSPRREPEEPKPKVVTAPVPQSQVVRATFSPRVTLIDADVVDRQARTEENRSSRRDIILQVVRAKEQCSIKDIATKLPQVSEKTIQRELSAMVEEGVLSKEGDRRWSTYRLAQSVLNK